VVDLRGVQANPWRGAERSRYLSDFVEALEHYRPDLVCRYLLAPDLPPPDRLLDSLPSGKVVSRDAPGAIPPSARVYHSLSVFELDAPIDVLWPAAVERLGLRFSATVYELALLKYPELYLSDTRQRRRYRARCQVLRFADALLVVSAETRADLTHLLDVEPAAVTVIGAGLPVAPTIGSTWDGDTDAGLRWRDVVDRAAEAFGRFAGCERRRWRRPIRLAIVSPFPPVPSGVARYSARLAEAVARQLPQTTPGAALDCFLDGRTGPSSAAPFTHGSDARTGCETFDAQSFPAVERAIGGYERVVYVLGNSEYHSGALAALRSRRGVVMAHEVRLTNLMRLTARCNGAKNGPLAEAVRRAYGDDAVDPEERHATASAEEIERLGVLVLREIVTDADQLLLSSEAARRLAANDLGPELSPRLGVLPFAMALDESELEVIEASRALRAKHRWDDRPLVASFGIVDPAKLPAVVVEAAALLSDRRDVELAFVGPASRQLVVELTELGAALGIAGRVTLTGAVDRSVYLEYLGRASVAVQLRAGFGGEASAAVGDCLAAAVPTIVSDVGWLGELPDEVVVKLDRAASSPASELRDCLLSLLDHPARMAQLSEKAVGYAAEQTFARTAAALIDALDLPPGTRS